MSTDQVSLRPVLGFSTIAYGAPKGSTSPVTHLRIKLRPKGLLRWRKEPVIKLLAYRTMWSGTLTQTKSAAISEVGQLTDGLPSFLRSPAASTTEFGHLAKSIICILPYSGYHKGSQDTSYRCCRTSRRHFQALRWIPTCVKTNLFQNWVL